MVTRDQSGPLAPTITNKDIWAQFKIDISGKEVQTAETYSHSWIANQFGHVCLGMMLAGILGLLLGKGLSLVVIWLRWPDSWALRFPWDNIVGSFLAGLGVAAWEWRAYAVAINSATGRFPVDRTLLRDNALTAAAYMVLGVAGTCVFRYFVSVPDGRFFGLPLVLWELACFLALVLTAIVLALPWLRQKIVWQKAALPYLFRLADAHPATEDDASRLQALIDDTPPPGQAPHQMIIAGPIGSGRTEIGAAIGTEFAFRNVTVRYLPFATLLEFAARSGESHFFDDIGPANIAYWPWSTAQVIIIDDIGPLLSARTSNHYDEFAQILDTGLETIRVVLERSHTVWVIGDPRGDGQSAKDEELLDRFARQIGSFCNRQKSPQQKVMVVQLEDGTPGQNPKAPRPRIRYL